MTDLQKEVEAPGGFEPPHRSFAERLKRMSLIAKERYRVKAKSSREAGIAGLTCY